MQNSNQIELLQKFLQGNISDQELKSLFMWLNSEQGFREYEVFFEEKWLSEEFEPLRNIDSSALFSRIETKMQKNQLLVKNRLLVRLRNAAAIFIAGFLIPLSYFTIINPQKADKPLVYFKESLSNEKVKKLTLPDGTDVWLMSGSTIRYPADFSGEKNRNVEVTGEAFFEVAKNSSQPFILDLGEVGLKVVGTSFDVMNYSDEDHINVVLKTGKIDLFKGKYRPDGQLLPVTPGQLVRYQKDEPEFKIEDVNVAKYTSWIEGILLFRDDPLSEVLKKLGRWYNIEIEINDQEVLNFPFTATIKNENLDQVVDLLQFATPFQCSLLKMNGTTKLVVKKK